MLTEDIRFGIKKNIEDQKRHNHVKFMRLSVKENNHQESISQFSRLKHSSYHSLQKQRLHSSNLGA